MPPTYQPPDNDIVTSTFTALDMIPKKLRGSSKFLDVVTWNLRWFHHKETERVRAVSELLGVLNADVLVLEEVADKSLEPVVELLERNGAGSYSLEIGKTGGQQRVAFLWDIDWVRSKDDAQELFGKGAVMAGKKDAFPRLPFWGYFTALAQGTSTAAFDFQLVGVHLKSQMGGGGPQRRKAAQKLAEWMQGDAQHVDADVLVIGDFNKSPEHSDWAALHQLEQSGNAAFRAINDPSDFSHLYYTNKQDIGSRLDLVLMSSAVKPNVKMNPKVIKWKPLSDFLAQQHTAAELKALIATIKRDVTDHLPVLTRFYLTE